MTSFVVPLRLTFFAAEVLSLYLFRLRKRLISNEVEIRNDRVDIIIVVDDENDQTISVGFWYCSTAGTAPEKNQNFGVDAREIVNMPSDGWELVQKMPWKFAVENLSRWKGTHYAL